jgi:hypothetical protein
MDADLADDPNTTTAEPALKDRRRWTGIMGRIPQMLPIILAAAGLLGATSGLAKPTTPAQLETLEWRLMKPYREKEIRSHFAPNLISLYADGRHDLTHEMRNIRALKLHDYALGKMSSQAIDADNVLVTYSVEMHGTVGDRRISGRRWVASLWHRNHGRWLNVYHTEVQAK